MFKNHLSIAIRNLLKFKGYSMINILGLSIGLTTGILILMYVIDEVSFDRFHTKRDRIYRIGTDIADLKTGAINSTIETNGWAIGTMLEKDYPEIESVIYTRNGSNLAITEQGRRFEERIFYASKDFFHVFTFPLIEGDPSTALSQPNTLVITESLRKKYFADQEAVGKTITFEDTLSFKVTGVMKDVPKQSHMQFDMLISFETYTKTINKGFNYDGGWGNLNVRNYVLLKEGANAENLFEKARNIYINYVGEDMKKMGMNLYVGYEPLNDIYLKTIRGNGMGPLGSLDRIYIIVGIAIFVILLACINFINLATARSVYRSKEVGLRKVVGSSRSLLIRQFMTESFLTTIVSMIIALALTGVFLPLFNYLMAKTYSMSILLEPTKLIALLALILIVSGLAGYYPALSLSSLRPVEVLKGKIQNSSRGVALRRSLVVFQFMISAGLIICTIIAQQQLDFMKNSDLGFQGNQVLVLDLSKADLKNHESFKNELKSLSGVEKVTFTNAVPGKPGWIGQWARAEEKPADESIGTEYMAIDEDYASTLGLTFVAGHNFDLDNPAELSEGLILNEQAVKEFGWMSAEEAIGKKVVSPSQTPAGTVIGVVKDYHEFGLQQEIYPMAMDYEPRYARYFAIKFNARNTTALTEQLESMWKKHLDGYDFRYFFLDENFALQYQSEQRLGRIFLIFSSLTILIGMIGLIGLVSFLVVSKTKEIGIRKILGASVLGITRLISFEFIKLVVIANILVAPLVWYFGQGSLEKYAYRISITIWPFIITFIVALLIAILTISVQSIRAALSNPIDSLRTE